MDLASPILDIASGIWDCIAHRAVYIRHLPQYLNSLKTAMEELKMVYQDVKEKVEREEKLNKKRTHAVEGWIRSVEAMEKEVNDLLAKADEETQKKCVGTCCPRNCRASYKLGKMIRGRIDAVGVTKSEGLGFSEVAEPLPTPPAIERPSDKTVGQDSMFEEVWKWIQDEQVGIVGLYGMGGVGKATLLTRINNQFLKTIHDFEQVMWVVVSQQAKVESVQRVIWNKLQIPDHKWESRSEDERALEILNTLKTKKFVLLLDDIWEHLDLSKVGIPPPNVQNKSKVIFTTRFSNVCRDMEAKKSIKLECLAWEEAFALFVTKVGEETLSYHPDIPKLAEIAAKECQGLPLALITIGRAMSGTSTPEEWERKIEILKNYPAKFPGMGSHLFPGLAFSYDSLCDDTVKSCFLYCSLYPEDKNIVCTELIRQWVGEGFLDECGNMKEARNRGEEIIESLKHACLLENGDSKREVKMHDVIREMALWLACENGRKKNKFVVKEKGELIKVGEIEKWKETQRMSLWGGGIEELRQLRSFPNIETFLARGAGFRFGWIKSFPSGFFTYMPRIKVLDFSGNTLLFELPVEVGNLVTLQYLNLSFTGVNKLPLELKNLKKIEVFDTGFYA